MTTTSATATTGSSGVPTLHHWVAAAARDGTGGRFSDVTNPATGEVSAHLPLASEADVDAAVDAAKAAFPRWRDTSLARRTQIVFRFRELLNARAGELAELITAEHGKVRSDARGEVARGQEVVEFVCGIPHLIKGGFTLSIFDASHEELAMTTAIEQPRSWPTSRCRATPPRCRPSSPSGSPPSPPVT